MPYVQRGPDGRIAAVSLMASEAMQEFLASDQPELLRFSRDIMGGHTSVLLDSDMKLIRVLEDLVELLLNQGVIRFTDLPEPAQQKLLERRGLRTDPESLGLLGGETL
ncbi:MAG: tryptophan synthase subunit beta like protein [Hydrogenophilales bacterium]|nr:tryptophan synthase subunit beta like protein [Hydrogenophilales bacterium]